jgi:hypothetical protein
MTDGSTRYRCVVRNISYHEIIIDSPLPVVDLLHALNNDPEDLLYEKMLAGLHRAHDYDALQTVHAVPLYPGDTRLADLTVPLPKETA